MHEMRLLKDLMGDILKRAESEKITKVTKIYLRMGEFTEIDPEILKFYFNENSRGTILENAVIDIEKSPTRELRLLSFDCE